MTVPGANSESTSTSLLRRVRSEDRAAWVRLVAIYSPLVSRWIGSSFASGTGDHDDVLQEVFLSVHRSLGSFRRDDPQDTFRGWLRVIARRKLADVYRQRDRETQPRGGSSAGPLAKVEAPELTPFEEESGYVYRRALDVIRTDFEESTWKAFWMTAIEDESVAEVAAILGMPEHRVRTYKARVLKRLRDELGDLEPDF